MTFHKSTHGEDADNKRGISVWEYEFENTDEEKEEIANCLYDGFIEGESKGKTIIILVNPYTNEDIEIEVEIGEYIELLIAKADEDEDLKDDEEILKYIQEIKKDLKSGK